MNKTKKFKQVLANHSRFLASRIAPEKTYVMTQMGSITREKRQRNSSLGPKVQDQETCLCNSKGFY